MSKIGFAVAVLVLSTQAGCAQRPSSGCLSGRSEALLKEDFSGPIVCSREDATFVEIGTVGDYVLYDYRYRFMPEHGAVMHGGQKVVMFNGARYAGQYALNPPPYANVSLKGSRVLFQTEGDPGVSVMEFAHGPPPQIFSGGQVSSLYR
jgi:hypothetical protein